MEFKVASAESKSNTSVVVRTVAEDEFEKLARSEAMGFGYHASDEYVRVARSFAELDRTFGAFEGDQVVGSATIRTSEMTVPGGVLKLGYVDDVSVLPTHRRRGIMTRIIGKQLEQMRERGEPLAALTSSESLIYERFGYGIATWVNEWTIARPHTAMKIPPNADGRLGFVSADEARAEWPALHSRLRRNRLGMVQYSNAYWQVALVDAEERRRGASAFFHVALKRDGRVAGLCSYRIHGKTVLVVFLMGEDAQAEAELWRLCFGIDLMDEIRAFNQPTDHSLPWRLLDPRRLRMSTRDHIWLRLVDVKEALASRTYAERGRISLRVSDDFCPWNDGVYTLEGDPEESNCVQGAGEPQIALGVSDLAAAYMGGVSFAALARAGRVRELSDGALALADRMFRTERQPWSLEL